MLPSITPNQYVYCVFPQMTQIQGISIRTFNIAKAKVVKFRQHRGIVQYHLENKKMSYSGYHQRKDFYLTYEEARDAAVKLLEIETKKMQRDLQSISTKLTKLNLFANDFSNHHTSDDVVGYC